MTDIEVPTKTLEQYRSYQMLRDRMHGATLPFLGMRYDLHPQTINRRCKRTFVEIQVMVMGNVKADPDSPRQAPFSLEEFNRDPQSCRMQILDELIAQLEAAYPVLKDKLLPTPGGKENGATD